MSNGTLKDLGNTGDPKVDSVLGQIREHAQGRNFEIVDAIPAASDGKNGNVKFVRVGVNINMYVKDTTWKKIT